MSDSVPTGMFNLIPSKACQAAADYWGRKAAACEESARLAREQADRLDREAALYRHSEQQWRDSRVAILRAFGEDDE